MMWYYSKDGAQIGPVSDEEIKNLIASNTLSVSDLVWSEVMPQWLAISQVPALLSAVSSNSSIPPLPNVPLVAIPLSYSLPVQKPRQGLAIASMVCGICGFVLYGIPGLVGLILGIVALVKIKKNPQYSGKGFAIAGIITGTCSLLLYGAIIGILIFAIRSSTFGPNMTAQGNLLQSPGTCDGNLNYLFGQYNIYLATHQAAPPSLGDLAVTQSLSPDLFVCPQGGGALFSGNYNSPSEIGNWVNLNSDYILIQDPNIILFEKPGHHPNGKSYVLYKTGVVKLVSQNALPKIPADNVEK